jgi:hypothetical protein
MVGSVAAIGIPGSGVSKYDLGTSGVQLSASQSIISSSWSTSTGVDGVSRTTVEFVAPLNWNAGTLSFNATGNTTMVWAYGSSNALALHAGKGSFLLNLGFCANGANSGNAACKPDDTNYDQVRKPDANLSVYSKLFNPPPFAQPVLPPMKPITKPTPVVVQVKPAPVAKPVMPVKMPTMPAFNAVQFKMVYSDAGWVAIGVSSTSAGAMIGSVAAIGIPGSGVTKYDLKGKFPGTGGVQPSATQSISSSSWSQTIGSVSSTIVKFEAPLNWNSGTLSFNAAGNTTMVWAYGSSNALAFHASMGSFLLNLGFCVGGANSGNVTCKPDDTNYDQVRKPDTKLTVYSKLITK